MFDISCVITLYYNCTIVYVFVQHAQHEINAIHTCILLH